MPIEILDGFKINTELPVDSRIVVTTPQRNNISFKYNGLRVFDTDERKAYVWNSINSIWEYELAIAVTNSDGVNAINKIPVFNAATNLISSIMRQETNKIILEGSLETTDGIGGVGILVGKISATYIEGIVESASKIDITDDLLSNTFNFPTFVSNIGLRENKINNRLIFIPSYGSNNNNSRLLLNTGGTDFNIFPGHSTDANQLLGRAILQIGLNTSNHGISVSKFSADSTGSNIFFTKSRSTVMGNHDTVVNGDAIGGLIFSASDGTNYTVRAQIIVTADGSNSGRMFFRISNNDRVSITSRGLRVIDGLDVGTDRLNFPNSYSRGLNIHDVNDGGVYTNIQLAQRGWAGSHGILFNALKAVTPIDGSLRSFNTTSNTGNTVFANNRGDFLGGAGAIFFDANGGTMYFDISPAAGSGSTSGQGQAINWGDPKMIIYRNGNIQMGGVSTGSPTTSRLTILQNSHNTSLNVTNPAASSGVIIANNSGQVGSYNGITFITSNPATSQSSSIISMSTSSGWGSDLVFTTRTESVVNTETMRIRNNGNIGIGISTPTTKLDVNGGIRCNTVFKVGGVIGTNDRGIHVDNGSSTSWEFLNLRNTLGTSLFVSGSSNNLDTGRLGIGTSTPSAKIHIIEKIPDIFPLPMSTVQFLIGGLGTNPGSYSTYWYLDNIGLKFGHNSNSRDIQFQVGSLTAMTIYTNRNIGIGTSTPSTRLHVNGIHNALRLQGIDHVYMELFRNATGSRNAWFGYGSANSTTLSIVNETAGNILIYAGTAGVVLYQGATSWVANSDIRLKNIHGYIETPIDKIKKLDSIYFNYKKDNDDIERRVGLIAQQVKEVLPEAVYEGEDGYLSLSLTEIVPLLVSAIKELNNKVDSLTKD
jgi:hypothetical protein